MREPGLTHKATMESETRAAARGGVTTVLDMPNVVPQTTTLQLLKERYALAEGQCHVNYGFYLGATNDNLEDIKRLDPSLCPGVKLFMGSSTGGMLVDCEETLRQIFRCSPTLIMAHCEDTERIKENLDKIQNSKSLDPLGPRRAVKAPSKIQSDLPIRFHPLIRDHEACYRSSELAVRLAKEEGARLHVAHITTAQELELFQPGDDHITAEACVPHLLFMDADYETLGTRIKCNPAIKTAADRDALRKALTDGRIRTIATDHAPHLLSEKEGGCLKAMSGMPMVQFSLPAMLSLADEGMLSMERVVELMCHNPARLYHIKERGFIREGYWADFTLVRRKPWTVTQDCIESRCGWSPLEGRTLGWQVEKTWVNGNLVWDGQLVNTDILGQAVTFSS
jgi:dihydroorotase